MQLPLSTLSRYGKAWYAFICAKLMPSTHVSDVTKERAVLLYCLVKGLDINVGEVIKRSILRAIEKGTRGGLPHSSLICGLCQQAGVTYKHDEPILHPMPPLDHSLIARYKVWDGGVSDPRGLGFILPPHDEDPMATDPTGARPATSGDIGSQKIDKRLVEVQRRLDRQDRHMSRQNHRIAKRQGVMHTYNASFNTALVAMFAKMHPNAVTDQFPTPPTLPRYPPSDLDSDSEEDDSEDSSSEEVDHDD